MKSSNHKKIITALLISGAVIAVNLVTPLITVAQYDPYGGSTYDPYGGTTYDPYGGTTYYDPYGGTTYDPYGGTSYDPYGGSTYDPYGGASYDPYGGATYDPIPVYTAPAYSTPNYYYYYSEPTYYTAPIYTTPAYTTPAYTNPVVYYPPIYTSPTYTPPPVYTPPTCTYRPACLDSVPPCDIAEPAGGWCPMLSCPPPQPTSFCNGTWQTTQMGIANNGSNCSIGWRCVPYHVPYPTPIPPPIYTPPTYTPPVYTPPTYTPPTYTPPTYTPPTYIAPIYTAPVYNAPIYNAPIYPAPVYNAPVYNAPIYPAPVYYSSYSTPPYPYYQPPVSQPPYVYISSNPSVISLGSSSVLNWNSSNATNCYASGGWSGTKSLASSETVYPQVSTTYSLTCYNGSGQASAQTTVSINNQQSLAPAVNITSSPSTIANGGTSLLVWSSSNASTCYAAGAWSGTKNLSGSETVSPSVASTYTLTCSNNVGSAISSASVYVNNVLSQTVTAFTAACVASPAIATVNRNVTFVAGKYGGTPPYTYAWGGDITGVSDVQNFIFDTTGLKYITLRVTDAYNRVATANCSVRVNPVQVSAATQVTPPASAVLGASTDYTAICESLGYIKTAAATCQTYTTCSDGKTYQGVGTGGNVISNTNAPAPGVNSTDNSGNITAPSTQVTSAATSTGQNGTKNSGSLLASALFNENGNMSRLAFMFIWYIAILFFIGFIALIYSAVRPRET